MAADEGPSARPTDAVPPDADTTIATPLAAMPPPLIVESSRGEGARERSWHSPSADTPLAAACAAQTPEAERSVSAAEVMCGLWCGVCVPAPEAERRAQACVSR